MVTEISQTHIDTNTGEVAIILLTMNQREKTFRCLKSLYAVSYPYYQILLWDNGSKDGTVEAVKQKFPEVLVHHYPQNIGVASGRNMAAKIAVEKFDPPYLLFLDNDMTVTPDFLQALAKPFSEHPHLAQTTGKIRDMADERRLYGAGGCRVNFWLGDTRHVGYTELDHGQYDEPKKCIPSGGCMLVRTDIFQQLAGFDISFDPYGPEDLDFGLRAIEAGYYGFYVPQAEVFHESSPGRTFEDRQYTEKYASNRIRQWFLFMSRHASLQQKLGFFLIGVPYLLASFVIRQKKKGNLQVAIRGLVRGAFNFGKSLF